MSNLPSDYPEPVGVKWYRGQAPRPCLCSWCGKVIAKYEPSFNFERGEGDQIETAPFHISCGSTAFEAGVGRQTDHPLPTPEAT